MVPWGLRVVIKPKLLQKRIRLSVRVTETFEVVTAEFRGFQKFTSTTKKFTPAARETGASQLRAPLKPSVPYCHHVRGILGGH